MKVGNTVIKASNSLMYLGIQLDNHLLWDVHVRYLVEKCTRYLPILTSLCHNLFGYSNWARAIMYNGTIGALFRYCSSLFYHRLEISCNRILIKRLERAITINIGRLYRSTGCAAACVLTGWIPIELMVFERSVLWLLRHGFQVPNLRHFAPINTTNRSYNSVKSSFRSATLLKWQEHWSTDKSASWTHMLIPNISKYLKNQPHLDFFLSQALSGHGCFGSYLFLRKRRASPFCSCGRISETPNHIFKFCPNFSSNRPSQIDPCDPTHSNYLRNCMIRLWNEEAMLQALPLSNL